MPDRSTLSTFAVPSSRLDFSCRRCANPQIHLRLESIVLGFAWRGRGSGCGAESINSIVPKVALKDAGLAWPVGLLKPDAARGCKI